MSTVTRAFVKELIDFAPGEDNPLKGIAEQQLDGTVALFNMLQRNRCAYLADEVGMGKTYVALGVMSLVRYLNPHARVVVIAPRENIQRKWAKDLKNFVRVNWKIVGNRVKSLQGEPAWAPVHCNNLIDFTQERLLNADRDFFNGREVRAKDLNPERTANPGSEHLCARLHRHPPDVGHARVAQGLVHLGDEPFPGEPMPPL